MGLSMKLFPLISLILLLTATANSKIRLYSRALAEKWVADSLKRIDSLRVADSVKVADSIFISRYAIADTAVKNENDRNEKEMEKYKRVDVDSSKIILPDNVDDFSARTIEIDERNPYAAIIDSLQNRIDSINTALHDADQWFSKMKTYPVSEKKRYLLFLIQNHYKDSSAVLTYCNELHQLYGCKLNLLIAIRNSQTNNSKSFMASHIEQQRQRIAELSNFLVALSPKVPFNVEKKSGEQSLDE
jgi:hypothetical protein